VETSFDFAQGQAYPYVFLCPSLITHAYLNHRAVATCRARVPSASNDHAQFWANVHSRARSRLSLRATLLSQSLSTLPESFGGRKRERQQMCIRRVIWSLAITEVVSNFALNSNGPVVFEVFIEKST
jgi:hypothetical protein